MFLKGKIVIKSNKGENLLNRKGLAVGIVLLLFVSSSFVGVSNQQKEETIEKPSITPVGSSMNFIWPSYGHDAQNTCLSTYPTNNNEGYEKWNYFIDAPLNMVIPVIDGNGTVYITSKEHYGLYAIYPNGTCKWHSDLIGDIQTQPAIGLNGTIYVGTSKRFHAFYPNGTMQWMLPMEKFFICKPVISPDGIIYTGTDDGYFYAVYPNGTIKWEYYLGYSIVAASLDAEGNIYFTARYCDYLYCLFPNGTLRWTFEIVQETTDAPLIDDNGTIYTVPVYDVIAINPDGTEKWRNPLHESGASPALSPDGTIVYSSYREGVFGLDPKDGHIRWHYQLGFDPYDKSRPAVSSDGTIFFAYTDAEGHMAYLTALNPDGSLKWTVSIASDIYSYQIMYVGAPSIAADGTVYITTWYFGGEQCFSFGYLYAFGELDPNAPTAPIITGPTEGKCGIQYEYTFTSTSPLGKDLTYCVLWGGIAYPNWTGPFNSGEQIIMNHTWSGPDVYTLLARARDSDNLTGPWGTFEVTMPINYGLFSLRPFLSWLFDYFPNAFPFLRYLFEK
jgi:outer membrane protein assembly factor BamB